MIVPYGAVFDNVIVDVFSVIVDDGAGELVVEEILANEVDVDNDHVVGPVVDAVADEVAVKEAGNGGDSEDGVEVLVAIVYGTEWFVDDRAALRTLNSRHCNKLDFKIKDQF